MKKLSFCLLAGLFVIAPACSKKEKKEAPVTKDIVTETTVIEPAADSMTTERQSGAMQPDMPEAKTDVK